MKGNKDNIYLVLEGPGKGGKDTVCKYLSEKFRSKGFKVIETFEPGGTERGNLIRQSLFELKRAGKLTPEEEMMLVYEARRFSMEEVVMPAMTNQEKTVVIGCRNYLSTFVYQQASGMRYENILDYHKHEYVGRGFPTPDLTLMILVEAEMAARRLGMIGSDGDSFDEQGFEFLKNVSMGYGELAYRTLRRPNNLVGPVMTIENNYFPEPEVAAEVIRGFQESAWRMVGNYFDLFEEDTEGKEPGLVYHRVSPMQRSRMRR
jgi:dTMP kinase